MSFYSSLLQFVRFGLFPSLSFLFMESLFLQLCGPDLLAGRTRRWANYGLEPRIN